MNNKFSPSYHHIKTINDFNKCFVIDLRLKKERKNRKLKISLIIILSIITISASSYFVNAASSENTNQQSITISKENSTELISIPNKVKMTSTVAGWYEITKISNERIDIKTNMQIYINGKLH